ncbi:TPA: hypothetical protein HA317_00340 [Candidatus Woesearchaeota archaeon]|nr:hypothetical protein [Candidatus Woesearchaeota archaeon]
MRMKIARYIIAIIAGLMISMPVALTLDVSHPASEVTEGTFPGLSYGFVGSVKLSDDGAGNYMQIGWEGRDIRSTGHIFLIPDYVLGVTSGSYFRGDGGSIQSLYMTGEIIGLTPWGLNARTQSLIVVPEFGASISYDPVTYKVTLSGYYRVMNPASGSYIKIAPGAYTLTNIWDYLYVKLPPSVTSESTVTPLVGALGSPRNFDNKDILVLLQRAGDNNVYTRFGLSITTGGSGGSGSFDTLTVTGELNAQGNIKGRYSTEHFGIDANLFDVFKNSGKAYNFMLLYGMGGNTDYLSIGEVWGGLGFYANTKAITLASPYGVKISEPTTGAASLTINKDGKMAIYDTGYAAPSATSDGWRIRTYGGGDNYGLGIDGSTQWYSTNRFHRWYSNGGTSTYTKQMELDNSDLKVRGTVTTSDDSSGDYMVLGALGRDIMSTGSIYIRPGSTTAGSAFEGTGGNVQDLYLTGQLRMGSSSYALPSAASSGWRMRTYGNSNFYGLGIDSYTQWYVSGGHHKWYKTDGTNYLLRMWLNDEGNLYLKGSVYTGQSLDVAEDISCPGCEAGDVVVADPDNDETAVPSTEAYDTRVIGVISEEPAVYMGKTPGWKPLALAGRVAVKADAGYGEIKRGDILVSSPTRGHAMVCSERSECSGAIIGKALSTLKEGRGKVTVLVSLS